MRWEIRNRKQVPAHEHQTTLKVGGMTCRSCIRHVKEALTEVEGVSEVEIEFAERKVKVKHQLDATPVEALVEALSDAGYAATTDTS